MAGTINELTRSLRRRQTPSEALLWKFLRNRKMNGFKFLRQHPIFYETTKGKRFFVADFYCAEKRFVLELDGSIHIQMKEYDAQRDEIMKNLGLQVLRMENKELKDLERVLSKINAHLLL